MRHNRGFQGHVTSSVRHTSLPIGVPLEPSTYLQPFSRYSAPNPCERARTPSHTHALQNDFIFYPNV